MATKGIWISIEIMHDTNLTQTEKFILSEIEQLTTLEHGCFASNKHFSELIDITSRTVTRCLKDLQDKGYISIKTEPGSRNHVRNITLDKMSNPPRQNVHTPLTKCLETKGNKQTNKQTNTYMLFLEQLKEQAPTPSKVTKTKDGEKLFKQIQDKQKLIKDYINHQKEKKEFAQRLTAFMEDYKPSKEAKVNLIASQF